MPVIAPHPCLASRRAAQSPSWGVSPRASGMDSAAFADFRPEVRSGLGALGRVLLLRAHCDQVDFYQRALRPGFGCISYSMGTKGSPPVSVCSHSYSALGRAVCHKAKICSRPDCESTAHVPVHAVTLLWLVQRTVNVMTSA